LNYFGGDIVFRYKAGILASLMIFSSLILCGCGESGHDYAEKAQSALEEYNYTAAMQYLDEWMSMDIEVTETSEFRQIYDPIVEMYQQLGIEPETGYEFRRNISYQGGNMLYVTAANAPAVVNVSSTNGAVDIEFYVRYGETACVPLPADEYVISYIKGDVFIETGEPNYFWHYQKQVWHEAIVLNVNYINGQGFYDSAAITLK